MKPKLVVLTGAGMSAESGISTFRDSDGLWENYDVTEVCTHDAWLRQPELLLDFYNQRRREMATKVPNEGHRLVARLEEKYDVTVVTQNVDDLHERAGSTKVIHLHGEIMKGRSDRNPNLIVDLDPAHPDIHMGDKAPDGAQLRPHIVFFQEAVPMIEPAAEVVAEADILVVIGTSLVVYPAAGLLHYARPGVPVYLIDPKPVKVTVNRPIHFIQKGASAGMEELCKELGV
jgi:NAD-dependent deacetylase